jgi:predicted ATPase
MLKRLRIQNFKAWRDTGDIRLAPLTVIFGANSAGKSSLGHLLLALKQTAISSDRKRALHLGDADSLIDLGTFNDCIYNHQAGAALDVSVDWALQKELQITDPNTDQRFGGKLLSLHTELREREGQPVVEKLDYRLSDSDKAQLDICYSRKDKAKFDLSSDSYRFVRTKGRVWSLPAPIKFYGFPDEAKAYFQNSGFLGELMLETESMLDHLYYLGPLRGHPKRSYTWAGDVPPDVGQVGDRAIAAILAASARKLSRGYRRIAKPFEIFIAEWLRELGLIYEFKVRAIADGRKEYEVLIQTHRGASEVKITDVGFGVSQVLPALVQAFYVPADATVWMEQPEIHLHPQVQAGLADVFINAIHAREDGKERNVQLIIESHSEHFLNRLQRRIAEDELKPEEVAIYFCSRSDKGAELKPLQVNVFGEIDNWPPDFFGDEMADLTGRMVAAMKRQKDLEVPNA